MCLLSFVMIMLTTQSTRISLLAHICKSVRVSCHLSPASLQEMIITELQAETTYSVTVGAYTTKGDGARSKPKLITTTGAGNVSHHC